jgi:hypothetical protein
MSQADHDHNRLNDKRKFVMRECNVVAPRRHFLGRQNSRATALLHLEIRKIEAWHHDTPNERISMLSGHRPRGLPVSARHHGLKSVGPQHDRFELGASLGRDEQL